MTKATDESGAEWVTRTAKISRRTVDASSPETVRYTVWDCDLKGFGLRVSPSGTKTYVVRYRVGGGRSGLLRQLVISRHGVLMPDEAREKARIALGQAATGQDPQGAKATRRADLTMAQLCDLYLAEGVAMKKASTLKLDRIRIARHIKPRLGRMKVKDIRRADIERLMRDVASGVIRNEATPHTRGSKGAASRTVGLLGGIFAFACDHLIADENPTRGVKRYEDVKRERFLSPEEIRRLGDVLAAISREGGDARHVAILRLLMLTGARKNEIAHLRWAEVDFDAGLLRLADSKTGKKVIPIGGAALQTIQLVPRGSGPYLFADHRDPHKPIANLDWAWVVIRERAGLPGVRIHDLRHSFASTGLAAGQGLIMLGKLLGHTDVKTTARYAHLAVDPVQLAADQIAGAVSEFLGPA